MTLMDRPAFGAVIGIVCCLATAATSAADPGREIVVDLTHERYDRWAFRAMALPSGSYRGRWQEVDAGLRGALPAGPKDRRPVQLVGLFDLEGDFEVEARFRARKLPRPGGGSGSNRVEVRVGGSDRSASVFREASPEAEGFGYAVETPFGVGDAEKHSPSKATSGRLKVRRVGTTLSFWKGEGGGPIAELGSVDFGSGPIREVAFQVAARGTTDAVDVTFEEVAVRADRIVRRESPPGRGAGWPSPGLGLVAAAVLAVLAARFLLSRR